MQYHCARAQPKDSLYTYPLDQRFPKPLIEGVVKGSLRTFKNLIQKFSQGQKMDRRRFEHESCKSDRRGERHKCPDPKIPSKMLKFPKIQARKRHININFFVRLVLGRPRVCPGDFTGFVPGTNSLKPGTNLGFLLILHSGSPANPGLSQGRTRVCPGDKTGAEGRHRKFM